MVDQGRKNTVLQVLPGQTHTPRLQAKKLQGLDQGILNFLTFEGFLRKSTGSSGIPMDPEGSVSPLFSWTKGFLNSTLGVVVADSTVDFWVLFKVFDQNWMFAVSWCTTNAENVLRVLSFQLQKLILGFDDFFVGALAESDSFYRPELMRASTAFFFVSNDLNEKNSWNWRF